MSAVLEVRDVGLAFGGLRALDGVNLAVVPGEIHGVIGPNGAGKTTLLDVITGVYHPLSGSVVFDGRDVTGWPPERRARAGLHRSFQTVGLAPGLSARENVLATVEALENVKTPFAGPAKNRRRRRETEEVLVAFGLEPFADQQVTELPLGLTKLLEMAKVFAGSPRIVLLDEPFAGLSTAEAAPRVELVKARIALQGTGVVIIEHDVPLLMEVCHSMTVLDGGRVVATGPPGEVMSDAAVRAAYLGDL